MTRDGESVLQEAERLIFGARQDAYTHPLDNFTRIGRVWGALLGIEDIPAEKVGLMMAGLKLAREAGNHLRDNLVDGAGYMGTVEMVHAERARREHG